MQEKIDKALYGLKDFQKKSVDYVYDQLYNKGKNRMLIADEVGLGKTIVAKGIIAKAYEQYLKKGGASKENPAFNVVYICSNLALAEQNIAKLNFLEDDKYVDKTVNRLTYLAFEWQLKSPDFLINSLTPGTSFEEKSHLGEAKERAILFCLLTKYKVFENRWNGLKWLLKGSVKQIRDWEKKIYDVQNSTEEVIRKDLYGKFRSELMEHSMDQNSRLFDDFDLKPGISLWHALLQITSKINHNNQHKYASVKGEIIRTLRKILSKLSIQYLNADIFILDEFQRYSNLIKLEEEATSPAIEVARAVFGIKDTKVLMLSATPFKPYTNDFDELNGEVHYKEFDDVLKFLKENKANQTDWKNFCEERKDFFKILRNPQSLLENFDNGINLKSCIQNYYKEVMVRTERLLASEDHNALIEDVLKKRAEINQKWCLDISPEDIEDFVNIDNVTAHINKVHGTVLPVPIEYVKSSPFSFSFLGGYQHSKKLEEYLSDDKQLEKLLNKTKHAWVDYNKIYNYENILPSKKMPNAKLRLLIDETVEKGGWKYLWIPPTIEYYKPIGAYSNSKGFSKTLIFSSWLLVPRMVASLVSYEVERESIGKLDKTEEIKYFKKNKKDKRKPLPQFTYVKSQEDDEPKRMNNMIYLYPALSLIDHFLPNEIVNKQISAKQVKKLVKDKIRKDLQKVVTKYANSKDLRDYSKWFWAAPLLMDKESENSELISNWLNGSLPLSDATVDADEERPSDSENSGRKQHFDTMDKMFHSPDSFYLPKLPKDKFEELLTFVTSLTIGSPAICFLRCIKREFEITEDSLSAAFNIASSFVTLFNKPESIATIRRTTEEKEYLDKVLEYSIDGNLQSLMDEFVYLLMDTENVKTEDKLANHISDILSVRTSTITVDDLKTFVRNAKNGHTKEKKTLRQHYAMDFGNQKVSTKSNGKQINIRQAFNSPFRPFVLASTSIGQEGLDFHLYCKKIFHWNLSSNPIDFEQREGRINRYKSLVIRQILAAKYAKAIEESRE